ncbi:putative Interferon-inducible GTPase 1 [Hypsibius exemplaris]|uniref:Interferon-inducible GTPase 1 n=1 Tax=Hypsibius exemplaris TaxID=2072580 RepID=A0A1W0WH71_HYPEX|nr:putative Interferon-inducible GTPase 1 [Hypsibius exemplaris]
MGAALVKIGAALLEAAPAVITTQVVERVIPAVFDGIVSLLKKMSTPPNQPKDIPLAVAKQDPKEIREAVRKAIGMDCVGKYNFGVTGFTGTGKSSFINAVRGLKPTDDGAATVGIDETTLTLQSYPDPRYPHIVYWDTPGCGTTSVPVKEYFTTQKLFCFDCLLIIVGNRILESDLEIARAALDLNIPVFFVRSQSDKSLRDVMENEELELDEALEKMHDMKKTMRAYLDSQGFAVVRLFVISAKVVFELFGTEKLSGQYELFDERSLIESVITVSYAGRS